MMRRTWRYGAHLAAAFVCLGFTAACETSSHKSVRTYDYRDDGKPNQPEERASEEELDSEYKMVSPGEMRSPGEPVVDPKHPK